MNDANAQLVFVTVYGGSEHASGRGGWESAITGWPEKTSGQTIFGE